MNDITSSDVALTEEELEQIERTWAEARPETWDFTDLDVSSADARAIAAAPKHVRKLLAEVRRLNTELEEADRRARDDDYEIRCLLGSD